MRWPTPAQVIASARYVTERQGGRGAVRDVCDNIVSARQSASGAKSSAGPAYLAYTPFHLLVSLTLNSGMVDPIPRCCSATRRASSGKLRHSAST